MKINKLSGLVGYALLALILSACNMGATPVPTQDLGAVQTEAFNQVLTQAAGAITPTPLPTDTPQPTATLMLPPTFAPVGGGSTDGASATPFAFNTPLAGLTPLATLPAPTIAGSVSTVTTKNGCNDGVLMSESPPYDGAILNPGEAYQKSFEFLNTGSCAWDEGYSFAFVPSFSTEGFNGYDINFRKTEDFTATGKGITFIIKLNALKTPGEHMGVWKLKDDAGNYFGSMVWVKYVINTK